MKKLAASCLITVIIVADTGCSTVRIRTNAAQPGALVCKECEGKLNRWFWGYLYNGEFSVNNCDSKALQGVQVKTTFWQGVITVATLGIYCPVNISWSCAKEQ